MASARSTSNALLATALAASGNKNQAPPAALVGHSHLQEYRMLRIASRYPSPEMMQQATELNQEIDRQLISIDEFTAHWRCTYQELAQLTSTSVSTVKGWFGSRQHTPTFEHRYRLTRIHILWMKRN